MNFRFLIISIFISFTVPLFASPASAVFTLQSVASQLQERPTLFIQCQLRYAMDCEELRRQFFEKLNVLDRVDNDRAMIKVL